MRTEHFKGLDKYLNSPHLEIWEIGNATGLRVSDILELKYKHLKVEKPTIKEQKTGKSKRIYIPKKTRTKLLKKQGNKSDERYVFEGSGSCGHITRQAVFKAFKKAADTAKARPNIGTHTMRKNFAKKQFDKKRNFTYVQNKLNHAKLSDSLLYLMNEKGEI